MAKPTALQKFEIFDDGVVKIIMIGTMIVAMKPYCGMNEQGNLLQIVKLLFTYPPHKFRT